MNSLVKMMLIVTVIVMIVTVEMIKLTMMRKI